MQIVCQMTTMLREFKAIKDVRQLPLCKVLLQPETNVVVPASIGSVVRRSSLPAALTGANSSQLRVVSHVCRAISGFTLVQGPPGLYILL
jgi:hypothetical protein